MKYLDLEQLLMLHVYVLTKTGGGDGIRDIGRLESAVTVQQQIVFGEELYPTLYAKAAAMMRGIVADHPFVDGNKRTATMSVVVLLELNGATLIATPKELEDFAVQVAVEHLSVQDVAAWFELYTKREGV